jgi:hypothetical protein
LKTCRHYQVKAEISNLAGLILKNKDKNGIAFKSCEKRKLHRHKLRSFILVAPEKI